MFSVICGLRSGAIMHGSDLAAPDGPWPCSNSLGPVRAPCAHAVPAPLTSCSFETTDEVVEHRIERVDSLGPDHRRDFAIMRFRMRRHGLEQALARGRD